MSCDGRNLAFVRRVRDVEALALKDLVPGTLRDIWFGLKYDLSITSAPISTSLTPESRPVHAVGAFSNVIPLWYKLSHTSLLAKNTIGSQIFRSTSRWLLKSAV
ncbi:hypothetical protein F5J12DRAFT_898648 [Pisolithus orientalis]|uniref:uncharacterized protein n=1 Tax=Pisolithus orientalis TaxID=936130 RepID=UPI002225550E|nr:uncharacterized protein F5J12DRAFT_898648 [Pisolithus orientalis]KAI5987010.1 hypothetical protein F5J12DRAFT_898648 [Pisolithus orientalis]